MNLYDILAGPLVEALKVIREDLLYDGSEGLTDLYNKIDDADMKLEDLIESLSKGETENNA